MIWQSHVYTRYTYVLTISNLTSHTISHLISPAPIPQHKLPRPPSLHPSNIPFQNPHWRHIHLPPFNPIERRRPKNNPTKHSTPPIHSLRIHRRRRRKKAKYKKRHQENQRYHINHQSCRGAEGPARMWERFSTEAFAEDAADAEDVGCEQSGEGEGYYGV